MDQTEQNAPEGETTDTQTTADQAQTTTDEAPATKAKIGHKTLKAIAENPHRLPGALVVAGDGSESGQRYAGTGFDDGRQGIAWSERHEAIVSGFLTSAKFVKNPADDAPRGSKIAIAPERPVSVYVVGTDENYDLIVEDGRQRRRAAAELNDRVAKIATWVAAHPEANSDSKRRIGALKYFSEAHTDADGRLCTLIGKTSASTAAIAYDDGTTGDVDLDTLTKLYPWATREFFFLVFGTDEYGEENEKSWIVVRKVKTDEAVTLHVEPILMHLTVVVAEVNPKADMHLLASITARQEGTIPTPMSVKARIFERLTAPGPNGKPAMSRDAAGKRLGMSGDAVTNYLKFLNLHPDVQSAIEADRVSMAIVISGSGKPGCMFTRPDKKSDYVALPLDIQAKIWEALAAEFPADADGNLPSIKGAKAYTKAMKIQKAIIDGKDPSNEPETEETAQENESASDAGEVSETDATASQDTTAQGSPQKAKPGKRAKLDFSRFDEHLSRAEGSLADPDENGLRDAEIRERAETRAAVVAVKAALRYLSGDRSALSSVPVALRDALIAATAEEEAPVKGASSDEAAKENAFNAVAAWMSTGEDTDKALDHTTDPAAKEILTGWIERAKAEGVDLMEIASAAA